MERTQTAVRKRLFSIFIFGAERPIVWLATIRTNPLGQPWLPHMNFENLYAVRPLDARKR